ncbi:MAG: hypothetical protein POELPBGB_00183 [Bacteroidia bacterium]|nr:hypothetical protein [Bacteroidia bacterium]
MAQEKGETVLVRLVEAQSGQTIIKSEIIISYGNNKTETIELQHLKKDYPVENINKLNEVINNLYTEGYEIVSAATNNTNDIDRNSVLWVFRKKK